MLIDIHSHHSLPYPEGMVSLPATRLPAPDLWPGQLYSVGIHPWDVKASGVSPEFREKLEEAACRPDVVAIGECGLDPAHPGAAPMFAQMLALRLQIELSEKVGKPLILHCVKCWNEIIGLRKDLQACQPWVVHGFRGKPEILQSLLRAGIRVSFGERFNPESLKAIPAEFLLAETDASPLPIGEILALQSAVRPEITPALLERNTDFLLRRAGCVKT